MNRFQECRLNQAPPFMFSLRPGVGKKKMHDLGRAGGKEILNRVTALDPENAQVPHIESERFLAGASDPATKFFDPEEISLREPCGQLGEECPISAAEIDFQRRTSTKKLREIQRRKVIGGYELDFRAASCIRLRVNRGRLVE